MHKTKKEEEERGKSRSHAKTPHIWWWANARSFLWGRDNNAFLALALTRFSQRLMVIIIEHSSSRRAIHPPPPLFVFHRGRKPYLQTWISWAIKNLAFSPLFVFRVWLLFFFFLRDFLGYHHHNRHYFPPSLLWWNGDKKASKKVTHQL